MNNNETKVNETNETKANETKVNKKDWTKYFRFIDQIAELKKMKQEEEIKIKHELVAHIEAIIHYWTKVNNEEISFRYNDYFMIKDGKIFKGSSWNDLQPISPDKLELHKCFYFLWGFEGALKERIVDLEDSIDRLRKDLKSVKE